MPPVIGRPAESAEDLLEELDLEPAPDDVPLEAPRNPRTTLVTEKKETEDLRRRIGMPAELEVSLDEVEEAEELEEMSFEVDPLAGLDGIGDPEPIVEPPPPRTPGPPSVTRARLLPRGLSPPHPPALPRRRRWSSILSAPRPPLPSPSKSTRGRPR